MDLYDRDEINQRNEKNKKLNKIIIVGIVVSVIVIVALFVAIQYLTSNPSKYTLYIDGVAKNDLLELIYTQKDEQTEITTSYYPIKEVASYFGYTANDGEYLTNFGDTNSCYIQSENEVAIFSADSNIIYKLDPKQVAKSEYESIKIDSPVIKYGNKLYVNEQGLKKGFNLSIRYNEKAKKTDINTLESWIDSANNAVAKRNQKVDENFTNKKAILDGFIVVVNEQGQKGVLTLEEKEIPGLGVQYDDITYIPQKEAFLIKKNGKVGIIGTDGTTKIAIQYDNLTLIDNDNNLYLAQRNGLFGVIDINEKTKIYIENKQIGVDISNYGENGLKNGYVLCKKLIPVQNLEGKWAFFTIDGQNEDGTLRRITNFRFDGIGCSNKSNQGLTYNLMVIDFYNFVVVEERNEEKSTFAIMNENGKPIIRNLESVYIERSENKLYYYMVQNGQTLDMLKYFQDNGIIA